VETVRRSNVENRKASLFLPKVKVFDHCRHRCMTHGVAGSDEIVPERGIDQSSERFPEGIGADFSGGTRDSHRSECPPFGRFREPRPRSLARKNKSARRSVGEGIDVVLEGRRRLWVERHVVAGTLSLDS